MNYVKPETRGHKARGYEVHVALWPVAVGFMPACFGIDAIHSHVLSERRKAYKPDDER